MNKKQIKSLVEESYTNGQLDEEKVSVVAGALSRKDLKTYVRGIKLEEKKHTVTVALASASVYNKTKKIFVDIFPDKTVSFEEDQLLMLGGRVLADDMVYDFSLKRKLENFIDVVEQTYDEK
jgi:F0F1-type ATP synthase delta subunit